MSQNTMSIILGGLIPAVLLGLTTVFQKLATKAGIGSGPLLIAAGLTIVAIGAAVTLFERHLSINPRGAVFSVLFGAVWAFAMLGIAVALQRYNGQVSQLVPIYNMSSLVAVVVSLWVFSEWQSVNPAKIVIAAVLIVAGGVLAALA